MKKLIIFALVATVGINFSCSESFLEVQPQGAASLTSLSNKSGVNALLIGAYSLLDGVGAGNTGRQSTVSNYYSEGSHQVMPLKVRMLVTNQNRVLLSNSLGLQKTPIS